MRTITATHARAIQSAFYVCRFLPASRDFIQQYTQGSTTGGRDRPSFPYLYTYALPASRILTALYRIPLYTYT